MVIVHLTFLNLNILKPIWRSPSHQLLQYNYNDDNNTITNTDLNMTIASLEWWKVISCSTLSSAQPSCSSSRWTTSSPSSSSSSPGHHHHNDHNVGDHQNFQVNNSSDVCRHVLQIHIYVSWLSLGSDCSVKYQHWVFGRIDVTVT